nr:MAG TPA: hypothetical protein [Caudoviricetes sp.]
MCNIHRVFTLHLHNIHRDIQQIFAVFISPFSTLYIQSKKQDSALKTRRALFHFFVYVL